MFSDILTLHGFVSGIAVGLCIGLNFHAIFSKLHNQKQSDAFKRAKARLDEVNADIDAASKKLAERKGRVSC